jgi:hypothetical protein
MKHLSLHDTSFSYCDRPEKEGSDNEGLWIKALLYN